MTHRRIPSHLAVMAVLTAGQLFAEGIPPIPPDRLAELHEMIRVQRGEQRFWQVPWSLTVTQARQQAAREGKPIFVWAGAGGAPIGVC